MWDTDAFLLQHARYLSRWPLFFDDELFDSPHQFGSKGSIACGTLATFHRLVVRLEPNVLADRVLLRLNSRESVDWLIPTIREISFLGHFLCSKAKICDLCSEVSCLYIRNTKIINLRESSKGDSFLYCRYRSSGLRAPAARPTRGVFHRLEPMKNEWFVALRFWKYEANSLICTCRLTLRHSG